MAMNLLGNLGLDKVTAAGTLPVNKYDGVIERSALVYSENKDQISHVITYKAVGGTHDGGTKDEWINFGTNPLDANGNHTTNPTEVASFTPTWTDKNQEFYKKRLLDLGFSEEDVDAGNVEAKDLEGIPVTFGIKENNGYLNISFAEKRDVPVTEVPVTMGEAPDTPVSQIPTPANLGGLV